MRLRISALVILSGLAVSLVARVAPAQEPTAAADSERAAVLAVVDSALAAISAEDFEGFTDLMLEETLSFPVWVEPDGRLGYRARTRAEERAREPAEDFVERGFDPEVRVQGPLAMVWLPYDFYVDGEWSHCGVDAFILVRRPEGWRIASLAWTAEQPPACRPHPDGPPSG